uniref:Uncharacterized protein n=1 Tax=Anguilla anguilla TaxID=7936 RepID=A0A0E9UBB6_ANGAN
MQRILNNLLHDYFHLHNMQQMTKHDFHLHDINVP